MKQKAYWGKGAKGHVWKKEDGRIDIFGYAGGPYCNGPICIKCGYGFCHHCKDAPEKKCAKDKP